MSVQVANRQVEQTHKNKSSKVGTFVFLLYVIIHHPAIDTVSRLLTDVTPKRLHAYDMPEPVVVSSTESTYVVSCVYITLQKYVAVSP